MLFLVMLSDSEEHPCFCRLNKTAQTERHFTAFSVTIDYIDPNPDQEKYQATLDYLTENSYVDFGVDVTIQDKILILSTCTSDENIRFVVAAKLIK